MEFELRLTTNHILLLLFLAFVYFLYHNAPLLLVLLLLAVAIYPITAAWAIDFLFGGLLLIAIYRKHIHFTIFAILYGLYPLTGRIGFGIAFGLLSGLVMKARKCDT